MDYEIKGNETIEVKPKLKGGAEETKGEY